MWDFNLINLSECRKILREDGEKLTDDEIVKLRDYLNLLAEIAIESYDNKKQNEACGFDEQSELRWTSVGLFFGSAKRISWKILWAT